MKTFLAQNQFTNSSPPAPRDESAVVSKPPADATAVPIPVSPGVPFCSLPSGESDPSVMLDYAPGENLPSMTMEVNEAPAPRCTEQHEGAGASKTGTEFIHEIFHYARKLMTDAPRFVLDEARFLSDIDEKPLFLREDGYLRRWEA